MNERQEAVIVTAFFEIGRGDFRISTCEARDDSKYIKYFKFWSRVKNHLVVYTTEDYREIVLDIRKGFGLLEKTTVIVVDDIFSVEATLYQKMLLISEKESFRKIRFYDNAVSNRADYDYIMLMKYWCMADAAERGLVDGDVVWMDFGFNHGGDVFVNPAEFDFTIRKTAGADDKIQLYALMGKNPAKTHSGQSLLLQFDTFNGSLVAAPASMCKCLYRMCKDAMKALISLDCIDDDQQLLLMAYKLHPKRFEVHYAWWFMPLKEYWGGTHLTVKSPADPERPTVLRRLRHLLGRIYRTIFGIQKKRQNDYIKRIREIVDENYPIK